MFSRSRRRRRKWISAVSVSSCGDWVRFDGFNESLYMETDELARLAGRVLDYQESKKGSSL